MDDRLRALLEWEGKGQTSPAEKAALYEYERLEHHMVMIESGNLRHLTGTKADDLSVKIYALQLTPLLAHYLNWLSTNDRDFLINQMEKASLISFPQMLF